MTVPAIPCVWDGDCFKPRAGFAKVCDREFIIGETYRIEIIEERSAASHRHYFAAITEAWANLPEWIAERFQSPEALRKYALIRTGFRDERTIGCSSRAEAIRVAAFIKPMDDFAVVTTSGASVSVWTAKSQSSRAMGKVEFAKSKTAVLDWVSSMIGVTAAQLGAERGAA